MADVNMIMMEPVSNVAKGNTKTVSPAKGNGKTSNVFATVLSAQNDGKLGDLANTKADKDSADVSVALLSALFPGVLVPNQVSQVMPSTVLNEDASVAPTLINEEGQGTAAFMALWPEDKPVNSMSAQPVISNLEKGAVTGDLKGGEKNVLANEIQTLLQGMEAIPSSENRDLTAGQKQTLVNMQPQKTQENQGTLNFEAEKASVSIPQPKELSPTFVSQDKLQSDVALSDGNMLKAVKDMIQNPTSVFVNAVEIETRSYKLPNEKVSVSLGTEFSVVDITNKQRNILPLASEMGNEENGFLQSNNLFEAAEGKKLDINSVSDSKSNISFGQILGTHAELTSSAIVESKTPVTTTHTVKDPHEVIAQIVNKTQLAAGAKNTEMIIQLKPEHLGELTFKVTVEAGVVTASFHSNNPEVRSIIEASLPQLRQDMANQGLKVDNVGVYAGLGQFLSNGQRDAQQQQQSPIKIQNKKAEEDFIEAMDTIGSKELTADGVDYRI